MSLKLGSSKSSAKGSSSSRPGFTNTGYSSINGNTISIDPSIRKIQDDALGNYASIYGDVGNATNRFLTQTNSLRDKYLGNEGAFMQARVNPVKQATASIYGAAQQDMGRRRVGGSSFGYSTLRDIETQGAREEADARALATNDIAGFLNTLNAQELQALNQQAQLRAQMTGESLQGARDRLLQEMQSFGLSTDTQSSQSGRSLSMSGEAKFKP
jgi:hypothetical protein